MRQMKSPEVVARMERVMGTYPHQSQLQLVLYGVASLTPTRKTQDVRMRKIQYVEPFYRERNFHG